MIPTFQPNDIVIYRPINKNEDSIELGSIVIAIHPLRTEQLIIKRIHNIHSKGIDLRGDNLAISIDSRHFGLIPPNYIIGVVENVIQHKIEK